MSLPKRYQVVIIAPRAQALEVRRELRSMLLERVSDLGLGPEDLQLLEPRDTAELKAQIDFRSQLVGVYFGGPLQSPEATRMVETLQRQAVIVLPVVCSPEGKRTQLPGMLHGAQTIPVTLDNAKLGEIAARLLEELHLLREQRFAFISYHRTEGYGVANQLYQALTRRSFDVFLDAHCLRCGEPWKAVIWDRILKADVFVLLDTPGALDSEWVRKELHRAQMLGLGVLQVLWPGHPRNPETEWCEAHYLRKGDLLREGSGDGAARLRDESLARVAEMAESLRARSLAARRTRVVTELCKQVDALGLTFRIHSSKRIDIGRAAGARRCHTRFVPVTGYPDAVEVQRAHEQHPRSITGVVYDSVGMLEKHEEHMQWLNRYLPLRLLPVQKVKTWLKGLK